ncbi:hypothetical protein BATDEDRAFT_28480 [Batrachochytrium dendrobatidis JAM81]|uniref:Telomeric single stranded DNA binding POT1/Cdc13 domain-containing protein n=1 Tax=Batrachochytrium dendrobatidis (strain JAM81 / FGSC 10211) TaxID=684364 RepID=F4PE97_BATDJ|nr:uncharacterized protein BATDEDRAFT_28480 [Batrachochytrium dendrobatidis JAM81]EGF76520.1 hypothetical protein BATDEDRAFT_28480 [Batrachochytrium dendrobatidis JAM81]|eukprot:XP_006682830.1 hypothetical protein BATDEDRAFT_28480 [Batrachochytrium dendrobatidis JAM81]
MYKTPSKPILNTPIRHFSDTDMLPSTYRNLLNAAALQLGIAQLHAIGDLRSMPLAHFFGVITGLKKPSVTSTGEYMLSLTLSDLTFDAHTYNGITINVFRQFESDFISILAIGDIVRLEVEIGVFNGRLQAVQKRISEKVFIFYPAGKPVENSPETKVVMFLRNWWSTQVKSSTPPAIKNFDKKRMTGPISQLVVGQFYDLTAKIVKVVSTSPYTLALVDYTTNSSLTKCLFAPDEYLPATILQNGIFECMFWMPFHELGSPDQLPKVGDIVCIKNMRCKIGKSGHMEGAVNSDPIVHQHFRKLSNSDPSVQHILQLAQKMDTRRTLLTQRISKITHISDILTDTVIPAKYTCLVKVVAQMPRQICNFTRPYCNYCESTFVLDSNDKQAHEKMMCPSCKSDEYIQHIYMYSLLMTDGTGYLPVILSGEDAIHFVGIPPCDLVLNPATLAKLKCRLGQICSDFEHVSDKNTMPEFECMIESYMTTQTDGSNAVRYRLFNTAIHSRS